MKLAKKLAAALCALAAICSVFASCEHKATILGRWKISSIDGLSVTELAEANGVDAGAVDTGTYFEFTEDGNGVICGGGSTDAVTWAKDGDNFKVLLADGTSVAVTAAAAKLTASIDGIELVLKK